MRTGSNVRREEGQPVPDHKTRLTSGTCRASHAEILQAGSPTAETAANLQALLTFCRLLFGFGFQIIEFLWVHLLLDSSQAQQYAVVLSDEFPVAGVHQRQMDLLFKYRFGSCSRKIVPMSPAPPCSVLPYRDPEVLASKPAYDTLPSPFVEPKL